MNIFSNTTSSPLYHPPSSSSETDEQSPRTVLESRAAPRPLSPSTDNAQTWDCDAFARSLSKIQGVDVSFVSGEKEPWVCNKCAGKMQGEHPVPSGFFCYKRRKGLIEHLMHAHGVKVY